MGYTTFFHHRMRLEVSSIFSHPQFNCVPWWPPLQRLEETPPNKKSKPLSRYMIRPQFRDSIYWISKTSKPNLRKAPLHDVWPLKLNALKQQSLKLPAMSESMIRSSSCTFQSVKISIPSQSPDCCQSFPTHHHLKTTEFRSGKGHKTSTRPFMEGILNDLKCTYIYYIYIYITWIMGYINRCTHVEPIQLVSRSEFQAVKAQIEICILHWGLSLTL